MSLLIDGYNLLHASGILGRGIGPGSLERSRTALLNFLAESLDERVLARTTVVFDAREAPPGLPRVMQFRGIRVQFADKGSDADEMIEQLIVADSSPRKLVVVSSDHRLHRAAKRRKATPVDSDLWYAETIRQRISHARAIKRGDKEGPKPGPPPTEAEVRFWLRQFGLEVDADQKSSRDESKPSRENDERSEPLVNPFPPGYAEDVTEED